MTRSLVRYLVDVSAVTKMTDPPVAARLGPLVEAGVVDACIMTTIELVAAVDDLQRLPTVVALHQAAFAHLDTTEADLRRAAAVQLALAEQGYRLPRSAPLVVAAIAERHRVVVLHHDTSFDLIAKVTRQNTEWVVGEVGAGSVL